MANLGGGSIIVVLISLAFFIGLMWAIRSIVLWYYKINQLVINQEVIIGLLRKNNELLEKVAEK
jgi:hypothetical protein